MCRTLSLKDIQIKIDNLNLDFIIVEYRTGNNKSRKYIYRKQY